ncbi:MAG: hypothetical protein GY827_06640 [Cytophagales bacterium]|nr:hypothetical protein [Cytophagales bacterium]
MKTYPIHIVVDDDISPEWWGSFCKNFTTVFIQVLKREPIIKKVDTAELDEFGSYLCISTKQVYESDLFFEVLNKLVKAKRNFFKISGPNSVDTQYEPTFLRAFYLYNLQSSTLPNYWDYLLDLVYDIHYQSQESNPKGNVFLAEVDDSVIGIREKIRRELLRFGYRVYPYQYLPREEKALEGYLNGIIPSIDMSIHLIGNFNENAQMCNHTELQNKLLSKWGQQNVSSNLERLVWFPLGFDERSEEHRLYMERFKRSKDDLHNAEVIQVPTEKLKAVVKNYLTSHKKTDSHSIQVSNSQPKIYLILDVSNYAGSDVVEHNLQELSCEVLTVDFTKKEIEIIEQHRAHLVEADMILIYYPTQNQQWLQMKVLDTLKAPGYGRKKELKGVALITPLNTSEIFNESFQSINRSLQVLTTEVTQSKEVLQNFLKPE